MSTNLTDSLKQTALAVKELDRIAQAHDWQRLLPQTREVSQNILTVMKHDIPTSNASDLIDCVKAVVAYCKEVLNTKSDSSVDHFRRLVTKLAKAIVAAYNCNKNANTNGSSNNNSTLNGTTSDSINNVRRSLSMNEGSRRLNLRSSDAIAGRKFNSNPHFVLRRPSPTVQASEPQLQPRPEIKAQLFDVGVNPSAPPSKENPCLAYLLASAIVADLRRREQVDSELEEAWTLQATTSHPGALAPALTAWLCKRYGWATDAPPSGKPQVPPIAITPASNAPSKHDENKSQSSRARHLQFTRRRAITETSGSPRAAQPKASVSTVSGLVSPRSEKEKSQYTIARPHNKWRGVFILRQSSSLTGSVVTGTSNITLTDKFATINVSPGKPITMTTENPAEKLVTVHGVEYRIWDPYHSKLAAAVACGLSGSSANVSLIGRGAKVLVAGDSEDSVISSASHISDIVGLTGYVYLRLFSDKLRTCTEFAKFLHARTNVGPLRGVSLLLDCVIVQDFANISVVCEKLAKPLLKPGGIILVCITVNTPTESNETSGDAHQQEGGAELQRVCRRTSEQLEGMGFKVQQTITLEPFFTDSAWIVVALKE